MRPLTVSDRVLFNTVLYAAKKVLPNDIINSLLDLQRLNGLQCKHHDLHSETVIDIQNSLVAVVDDSLNAELRECSFYSIMCDESTDLSVNKNLIVYVRFVIKGTAHTKLLGNVKICDGTADGILQALLQMMKERKLDTSRLVGFGSDGASVMTGRISGVGVLLNKHAPYMIQIHCMAHRLALVCVDAASENPYMQEYRTKLGQLYSYFSKSSVRCDKLDLIQEVLNDEKVRLKEPIAVRWLAMHSAVIAVHKSWKSLVTFFSSEASQKANDLKDFICTYTFVAFTALLNDVLGVVTALSKKFQTDSVDVSAVNVHVNVALASLMGMKVEADAHLDEFFKATSCDNGTIPSYNGVTLSHSTDADKQEFLSLRDAYLDSLIEHLEQRLVNTNTEVLNAFSVLEPNMATSLSVEDRAKLYTVLESHFQVHAAALTSSHESSAATASNTAPLPFVDVPALKKELVKMTPLLSGCYSGLRFDGLARMLLLRHKDDFPQSCRLAEIGLCLPVSTASCERGFSLQNRIKIKSRTRLLPQHLELLMKMAAGPEIESFALNDAVDHWYRARRRRLGRLYQPSKQKTPAAETNGISQVEQCECEEEIVTEFIDDVFGVESD